MNMGNCINKVYVTDIPNECALCLPTVFYCNTSATLVCFIVSFLLFICIVGGSLPLTFSITLHIKNRVESRIE